MATTKKFLQAAAGAAGGAAEFTAIEDVFSTYLYTGNGSAQTINNNINLGQSFGSGSAEFDGVNGYLSVPYDASLDLASTSTDFTIEAWVYRNSSGIYKAITAMWGQTTNVDENFIFGVRSDNQLQFDWKPFSNFNSLLTGGNLPVNSWSHVAVTRSGNDFRMFIDGSQVASINYASGTNAQAHTLTIGYYGKGAGASPTSYWDGYISNMRVVKGTALYTANFTPPTSELTAVTNTSLLTCQGADPFVDNSPNTFTITQNGNPTAATFGPFDAAEAGQGGLVWTKNRSVVYSHHLFDTERGVNRRLRSDTTEQELLGSNSLTSFNANGFSLKQNGIVNTSGNDYASWTFRKAPRFFDVVTYTGNGSTQTIAHNLGTTVGTIITKRTDSTGNWNVLTDLSNPTSYLSSNLNTTDAASSNSYNSGNRLAQISDDQNIYLGSEGETNTSGGTYVAYLFAHDPLGPSGDGSDGLIACGSVTMDGSGAGSVDLGWEPQWLLTKQSDGVAGWGIVDSMRGIPVGSADSFLLADNSNAESTYEYVTPTATGFNLSGLTASGTYIYIAIRRGPMRVPTSGTEVFAIDNTNASPAPSLTSGFPVDLGIMGYRSGGGFYWADRMRGAKELTSSSTAAEASASVYQFDFMDGFLAASGIGSDANYMLRRAPNFFDIVAYTGDDTIRNVPHNLKVAPEMFIVKQRTPNVAGDQEWQVYHKDITASKVLYLNSTSAALTRDTWNNTDPTDTVFTVKDDVKVNKGSDYIAYLFASLDGVSKVGSYTGNGASQTIDCGFTSGARFVLIKRTSGASDWYVFDTARGIVSGTDPYLNINSSAAENQYGLLDFIDPDGSGFIADNNYAGTNQSGESYIFLAIA